MGNFLIVVAGPTGVGKTALSIQLARQFNTEIVSADARQIYREMLIGTARPTTKEMDGIPHGLIGHISIQDRYDARKYALEASEVLKTIHQKNSVAILCGGSGLYIQSLLEGFDDIPEVPDDIRERLAASYNAQGLEWLQNEVEKADPEWYAHSDQKNIRRLLRALEVFTATGKGLSHFQVKQLQQLDYTPIWIGIDLPRTELYQRINQRVMAMVESGLFEEAEKLYPFKDLNALQTVGYREIFEFMDGRIDRPEAIQMIQQNTRHYAKRQLTWFRKNKSIQWFRPDQQSEITSYILKKINEAS